MGATGTYSQQIKSKTSPKKKELSKAHVFACIIFSIDTELVIVKEQDQVKGNILFNLQRAENKTRPPDVVAALS